jgi:hypothetical protein
MNRTVKWTVLGVAAAAAMAGFILQDPRFAPSSEAERPPSDGTVAVTVRKNGEECLVRERPMPCAEIGRHLRDVLKIPPDAPIVVSVEGTQDSTQRARRARLALLESGFADVTSVGFVASDPSRDADPSN